jgi:hypothetical protein
MASLAAGLQATPGLDVARLATCLRGGSDSLRGVEADVIAFDLADLPIDLPVALLREHPDLLLLGMDPTSEELFVLSGHHACALSVADLVTIIADRMRADSAPPNAST